jgi:hypothetical protein
VCVCVVEGGIREEALGENCGGANPVHRCVKEASSMLNVMVRYVFWFCGSIVKSGPSFRI